jgi:long-chain acyl-CoA synthetase
MLPPAHLFEMMAGIFGPLACGARVLFPGPLLPNRIIAALREEAITHAVCVPALLDVLFAEVAGASRPSFAREGEVPEDPSQSIRERMGGSLRTVFVGGAALSPEWVGIARRIGLRLEVGYGLTEAAPVVSMGLASEGPPGSVGRPLPGIRVRIGTGGEIQVKGGNVMLGYHNDREANAEAFEDGWLRTGDRGSLDPEGFLFVTGRIKEAVVAATGETLYPDEAEPCYASPLFREHCVAPVPGPDGNDVAVLFALPASAEISAERLQAAFRELRAAAPSRLRVERLVLLGSPFPRTATGKIRRRMLGEAFAIGQLS